MYRLRSVTVVLDCVVYHMLLGVPFTFCHGHTRLCRVPDVCLVYCLCYVMVILDCVVYHMVVWCTVYDGTCLVYRLSSVMIILTLRVFIMFVWCTLCPLLCLYGVRLCFVSVVLPLLGDFHICMVCSVHVVTVLMTARP